MTIDRVERLIYGVEDVDAGIRYHADWGLERAENDGVAGGRGAVFRTQVGQRIEVRPHDAVDLPPAPCGSASTLRGCVWGVSDKGALKALGDELARDRDVREGADGTLWSADEAGYTIGFAVARPEVSPSEPVPVNFNDRSPRMNVVIDPPKQVGLIRLGHVVYNVTQALADRAAAFYIDRLGFRLSDRTLNGGDFMRADGSHDHHSLFLIRRSDMIGFDHAAYEVRSFDEIMTGGRYMKEHGWSARTTPGRHILGSNMYWYFYNPCGGATEYFADMDRMDDSWEPRVWEQSPGFSLWSLDDGAM